MLKTAVTASLLVVASTAFADIETTTADTLVVVTPNAPVVVTQSAAAPAASSVGVTAPGATEMPPPPPVAPATAIVAPQNEDWNKVSHINGVPVKVGERQDHLLESKQFNLSANPFGVFFGYYDAAGSVAFGQNLALTIAVSDWDVSNWSGYQIGVTLPVYFRKTFSGPLLEGGLLIRNSHYAGCDVVSCWTPNGSWAGPQLMVGWHWTFDPGLNVAFAAGVAKQMGEANNDTVANGYFRVGYAF